MFLRVIRADKELRSTRAAGLGRLVKLKLPHRDLLLLQPKLLQLPCCPDLEDGVFIPSLLGPGVAEAFSSHDRYVYHFLHNSRWVLPGSYNNLGTTWLELLIAYACNGGTLHCAEHILNVPTLHQASKEFRMRAKRIVRVAFAPEHQACFAPFGISFVRLNCLGIATLLPGIQGQLCMPAALRDYVFRMLVGSAHKLKPQKIEAVMRGTIRVPPTRLSGRLRMELFHRPHPFGCTLVTAPSSDSTRANPVDRPAVFFVSCPHCSAKQDVSNRKLYGPSGWTSIVCARCGKSSAARKWGCQCGLAWVACSRHQPEGYACIGNFRRIVGPVVRVLESRLEGLHDRPRVWRKRKSLRASARSKQLVSADDVCVAMRNSAPTENDRHIDSHAVVCLLEATQIPPTCADSLSHADAYASRSEPAAKMPKVNSATPDVLRSAALKRKQADSIIASARLTAARHSASASSSSAAVCSSRSGSLRDSMLRLLQ